MLQYGNEHYIYNKNGYLTTKYSGLDTTKYTYDNLGNLLLAVLPNGTNIEYVVDANNRRIAKKVDGRIIAKYLYQDQLKPVVELDSLGDVKRRYIYGVKQNVPDYYEQGGLRYRIITDHLGSVRLIVKESTGEIVTKINYDEYGKEIFAERDTSLSSLFFGYAGGLADTETGLIRFGARDYNPVSGRWSAKDPIGFNGGDYNLFGYVLTDPINLVDRDGKTTGSTQNIFMIAVFNATVAATESALNGKSLDRIGLDALVGGASSLLGAGIGRVWNHPIIVGGVMSLISSYATTRYIDEKSNETIKNNLDIQQDIAANGILGALVAGLDGCYESMKMNVKGRMILSVVEGVISTIYKKKVLGL